MMQSLALTQIAARTMKTKKHVIIAGFGRSGQNLARLLSEERSIITHSTWTPIVLVKRKPQAPMFRMAMLRVARV